MRIAVLLFLCSCAYADSQKDRDAVALATANAQYLRDLATIDRLMVRTRGDFEGALCMPPSGIVGSAGQSNHRVGGGVRWEQ